MRYEPNHKARTHRRILKTAARRFLAEGLDGLGVATVMKSSGLTVGGFYKHFRSKEQLLAEAVEEGFCEFGEKLMAVAKQAPAGEAWKEIIKWYLSVEHCEHTDTGCPVSALAPDIARATPQIKKRIAAMMQARRERLMKFMPGHNAEEKERSFIVIFTAMAGAVSVARMMPDLAVRQRTRSSVRDHLLESF
jgi:TetR/AcrR family transcriptional regulator, transcriptional repressor for nem operon